MQELPKLQELLNEAMNQAAEECCTLLGQQLEIRETTVREVTRDDYFNRLENASFVAGISSLEDYQGVFCLVVSLRDAIILSGTLLGVPAARIKEKKKLAIIEPDDVDAFSEIANQMIGSFNSVFKRSLPRKAHLKQLPPKKYVPKQDPVSATEPIAEGDYYLMKAEMSLPGSDMDHLDILIPLQLAKMFDLRGSTKTDKPAQAEAASSASSPDGQAAVEAEPDGVLILDDNAAERQEFQDILAASGVVPVGAALNSDLKKLLSGKGLKAVLLSSSNVTEEELMMCHKISSNLRGTSIPIIMCAGEWTRTSVLKALKNGAGDIMLTPCSPEELTAKVLKRVNVA